MARREVPLWSDGGDTVRRHNRFHSVQVRSCRICAAHGNAVVVHPTTRRPY